MSEKIGNVWIFIEQEAGKIAKQIFDKYKENL